MVPEIGFPDTGRIDRSGPVRLGLVGDRGSRANDLRRCPFLNDLRMQHIKDRQDAENRKIRVVAVHAKIIKGKHLKISRERRGIDDDFQNVGIRAQSGAVAGLDRGIIGGPDPEIARQAGYASPYPRFR